MVVNCATDSQRVSRLSWHVLPVQRINLYFKNNFCVCRFTYAYNLYTVEKKISSLYLESANFYKCCAKTMLKNSSHYQAKSANFICSTFDWNLFLSL